jgi:peptidoglycan/xylan/chitin deacetylase (PgdA/CDA1 family)
LDESRARGHSLGIHGYDHSNRTPFVSHSEREIRLNAALPLIERYEIRGYRAPSLVRTKALLECLADHYQYDSSIPTSGGLFPTPNNGCASARPFRLGNLIEIPISLPRDGSMRFLGYKPSEILNSWIDCAEKISRSGGVVVLLTHCERHFSGNPDMLRVYRDFLEYISSSDRFSWSTPNYVCRKFVEAERATME